MGDRSTLGSLAVKRGLVGGPFGSKLGKKDYVPTGVPVIRGQNLDRGRFVSLDDCVYVTPEKVKVDLAGNVAAPGDLVFTQRGTLGQVAIMPDGAPPSVISQSQMRLRVDREVADPSYVYYWATSDDCLRQIGDRAIVSGVPHINLGILRELSVPTLPLTEQRRIAGVLGAFDDLIDTDLRLQQLLHEIGRAAYLAAVVAESATVRLAEVAEFHNRARVPLSKDQRMSMPGSYPYYGATGKMDSVGKYLFDGVHVLVGEDGSVVNADGSPVVQMVWGKYWVNNHAHVLSGSGVSDGLLRQALETSNVTPHVTGAVQPKLSMGRLKELQISIPTDQTVSERLDELAWAERELIDETASLTAVRDALLPLLMSGRITVDEVWEAVS